MIEIIRNTDKDNDNDTNDNGNRNINDRCIDKREENGGGGYIYDPTPLC